MTMDPNAVLYPGIAMFFLTFAMVLYLGVARYSAVRRGDVSIKYYRVFNEGQQPERLQLISRHVQNHFEIPPLFYVVLLFIFVAGDVTALTVGLAWSYFFSRCVHSYIHLGSNNVSRRFFTYATSGLILASLWLSVLVSVLTRVA